MANLQKCLPLQTCTSTKSCLHYLSILINHPGQLSLVIPLWVGAMSTSDGHGQNDKFCITVGPFTRTAGILT